MRTFEIGDIVIQNGHDETPLVVTGFISDKQRLFVRDPSCNPFRLSKGNEFEIWFGEVTEQYRKIP